MDYDTYLRSDPAGRDWIMRQMFIKLAQDSKRIDDLERLVADLLRVKTPAIGHFPHKGNRMGLYFKNITGNTPDIS